MTSSNSCEMWMFQLQLTAAWNQQSFPLQRVLIVEPPALQVDVAAAVVEEEEAEEAAAVVAVGFELGLEVAAAADSYSFPWDSSSFCRSFGECGPRLSCNI